MQACFQTVHNLSAEKYCDVSEDTLLFLCQLPDGSHERLHSAVQKQLKAMRNDPVVAQLTLNEVQHKDNASLEQLFVDTCMEDTPEVVTFIPTSSWARSARFAIYLC